MNVALIIRLSIMMFLQFFLWGSWYATVGTYMTANGMSGQIANVYSVGPIAAILSPLFLGLIADRYFPTERVLGLMHLIGGGLLLAIPYQSSETFVFVALLHMLCYMPTLALTNNLAFTHIKNQEVEFPIVRVAGTIGWIVAGLLVSSYLKADAKLIQFQIAGYAAIALGVYCFTLPHTPPPAKGQPAKISSLMGFDAIGMMRDKNYAIFIVSSFLVCIPLAAYYAYAAPFIGATGDPTPAGTMTYGQMSEVFFMLAMPLFFARLGVKKMLLIGMLAWVIRYGLFSGAASSGAAWMILGGVLLHGICYDFFFVTGYIYADKAAPKEIRGQAQSFLVLVTQGLGMLIGSQICGRVVTYMADDKANPVLTLPQWHQFWMLPAGMALVVAILFFFTFSDKSTSAASASKE